MKSRIALLVGLVLSLSTSAWGADIRTVLDNAYRTIDWENTAGVSGGIPTRTTICATLGTAGQPVTFTQSVTATQINNALAACADNGVVFLNAGRYNVGGINFSSKLQNVTLRGAGPNLTKIALNANGNCPYQAGFCIGPADDGVNFFQWNATNHTNWTAGFTKGTTDITVASAASIGVGDLIGLDQLQSISDNGGGLVSGCRGGGSNRCPTFHTSSEALGGGDWNSNWGRGLCSGSCAGELGERLHIQFVRVTAKNGNVLTITPGLHTNLWDASLSPQVYWFATSTTKGYRIGVEEMTIDAVTIPYTGQFGMMFFACDECWLYNVRYIGSANQSGMIRSVQTFRNEFRNVYLYGTSATSVGNYGFDTVMASDIKIINTIGQHISGYLTGGMYSGVLAYNFGYDSDNGEVPTWMQHNIQDHGANYMVLHEGNYVNSHMSDNLHGAAPFLTDFRNFMRGQEDEPVLKTQDMGAVMVNAFRRGNNYIGNILGTPGSSTTYQDCMAAAGAGCTTTFDGGDPDHAIYISGFGYTGTSSQQVSYDPVTHTSMVRWGNCDAVNGLTGSCGRFQSAEVAPSGALTNMPAVSVPDVQTLPNSFFLTEADRLQWWNTPQGAPTYPPIGPDVTGGNEANTGGHVHKIPAQLCFENSMADDPNYGGSNAVRLFDPSTCYTAVSGNPTPRFTPTLNLRVAEVHADEE